jgi:hypothetical protein
VIEKLIPLDFCHHLFYSQAFSYLAQSFGGTSVQALKAKIAFNPVNLPAFLPVKSNRPNGTGFNALAKQHAFRVMSHEFGVGLKRLWVLTPLTPQRAALHEYGGPEARSILDTVPLEKKYQAVLFFHATHRLRQYITPCLPASLRVEEEDTLFNRNSVPSER